MTSPSLLFLFETDCPTCALTVPYLNRLLRALPAEAASLVAVSQDGEETTARFVERTGLDLVVTRDENLVLSRRYDPDAVPAIYVLDGNGAVLGSQIGFDKQGLNELAAALCRAAGVAAVEIARDHDGNPPSKPGCSSRHRETDTPGGAAPEPLPSGRRRASRIELDDGIDAYEYCFESGLADGLPVIPPTAERVDCMLRTVTLPPEEVVALVPPNYGAATVEKIAACAVMAGCAPPMMRVLIPLMRGVCDERFNIHGIQATTHFAAPLVIVNGPVRGELGFASGSNVFSNVARANSTLGRALQLILLHWGGARPGEIDMSTLGNPGKFSYCIAENEEESPWEPLHVERGLAPQQSAITLFAAEAPHGVSEHNARESRGVLKTICYALATVWSYRVCVAPEAVVVLCPEHVRTLRRDGFGKQAAREFLFENTGVPLRAYESVGEGTQMRAHYTEVMIDGEPCYRKFRDPAAIHIVVAGGGAGKFSAVIGSWGTGPRGSQMVTYPIDSPAPMRQAAPAAE